MTPITSYVSSLFPENSVGGNISVSAPGRVRVGIADGLAEAGTKFVNVLKKAEETSAKGLTGEASAYDVATRVMEAERTLRMVISARDKIVSAYLEISRMQI